VSINIDPRKQKSSFQSQCYVLSWLNNIAKIIVYIFDIYPVVLAK
jgi:hypothetical protein